MSKVVAVSLSRSRLSVSADGREVASREVGDDDPARFEDWCDRYPKADDWSKRFGLGGELRRWLEEDAPWIKTLFDAHPAGLCFEIHVEPGGVTRFLDAPWELLADDGGFLAERVAPAFSVARRVVKAGTAPAPSTYRPAIAFMAADPRDNRIPLNYDEEERAILEAVGGANVDFLCDDTGSLAEFARRIRDQTEGADTVPIVHLSCHGNLGILALEDEYGGSKPADADDLAEAFRGQIPRLLVLSACHSGDPDGLFDSLAADLIRHGFPAVLSWSGKVRDLAATVFAAAFYQGLTKRLSLDEATSLGRRAVATHREKDIRAESLGRRAVATHREKDIRADWHRARLFLGADGGGPITAGRRRRPWHDANSADKEFLDRGGKVPVASRGEFVGRRRPLQEVLRALGEGKPALIHGMGQHGKSSLAARVASRYPSYDPAVVFGDYTTDGILAAIRESLTRAGHAGADEVGRILDELSPGPIPAERFRATLYRLLRGPLRELRTENAQATHRPILLIVDDFEQALDDVAGDRHVVKPELRDGIAALIEAFAEAEHDSRLLITSRFLFTCPTRRSDATSKLVSVPLPGMSEVELRRQVLNLSRRRAAEISKEAGDHPEAAADRERELFGDLAGVIGDAFASPSLMSRIVKLRASDPAAFERYKVDAAAYRATGQATDQALIDHLELLAIDGLLGLLSPDERELLDRSAIFQIPAPESVAARLQSAKAAERLIALGLFNRFESPVDFKRKDHVLVDPLVRPKLGPVDEPALAKIVCRPLFEAWGGREQRDQRSLGQSLELSRLGLATEDAVVLNSDARSLVASLQESHEYRGAAAVGDRTLGIIVAAGLSPDFNLLRWTALAKQRIGEIDDAFTLLDRAAKVAAPGTIEEALVLGELGELLKGRGELDRAVETLTKSIELFELLSDEQKATVILGRLADILYQRGRVDEALAILGEKVLPAFERLGDVREAAVTHGKIADILFQRGRVDEALAIRRERELPVYERLGDVRSAAVTHGKIADILFQRGQLDEALAIRRERQLPVYERLGDVRSAAVTHGKIADILFQRGQLDEALAIRRERELPVYERLGDVRLAAVTHGQIADILFERGQLDEALAIRRERELPVFERLGDVRSVLVCRTNIAVTLLVRGRREDLPEAVEHLMWSHQTALERGFAPEAEQIGEILSRLTGLLGGDASGRPRPQAP